MEINLILILTIYIIFLLIYGIIVVRRKISSEKRKYRLLEQSEIIRNQLQNVGGDSLADMEKNDLTLEESISKISSEESKVGIDKAVEILSDLISEMYANYEFRRHDPYEGDNTSSYGLVMRITGANVDRLEKLLDLFVVYFRYRLDEFEVAKAVKENIEKGLCLPTGNVVITGVNISSPLRKPDVDVIIEFMTKEQYDKIEKVKEKQRKKINSTKGDTSGE